MQEIWKAIPGWAKYYQASNLGNIKTLDRITIDSIGRTLHRREKVLKQSTDKYGYNYVVFNQGKRCRTYKVHRLVCLCFFGPSKLQVNHKDMIKTNNALSNLEYVTQSENMRHARKNKTYKPFYHKLSPADKVQIKIMRLRGVPYKQIALHYKIHPNSVFKIKL